MPGRRLGPGLPVAALSVTITAVDPGSSWSWRVAGVEMDHALAPAARGGCEITLSMRASAALELALRAYAPIAGAMLRRLAAVSAA